MKEEEKLRQKISELEERISLYEQDGMWSFFWAQNRKLNELTNTINDLKLKISDEESKSFDRWWKSAIDSADVIANLISLEKILKERFALSELKETEDKKSVPFIEEYIKSKRKR